MKPAGFLAKADNTLVRELVQDSEGEDTDPSVPRQVEGGHYVRICPTPPPNPSLVVFSPKLCARFGLGPNPFADQDFVGAFSGKTPIEGWSTAYGCHHIGEYVGQLGDGRAVSIAEIPFPPPVGRVEFQLKGGGRTPFNRSFDGKCVLRSSLREFLISEHMEALGVPATGALAVFRTGDDVVRPWFPVGPELAKAAGNAAIIPRHELVEEAGAVTVRVASSFLRFGHFELWWQRRNFDLLDSLTAYAVSRSYPHLLDEHPGSDRDAKHQRIVSMYAEICRRSAFLVSEWMRVGYVHGNMNSDNISIDGVALDFGPFGMMERFDPDWNPWLSTEGYAFSKQPRAMHTNLSTLHDSWAALLRHQEASDAVLDDLRGFKSSFPDTFQAYSDDVCRRKLGIAHPSDTIGPLWSGVLRLMEEHGADFTRFFRLLCLGGEEKVPAAAQLLPALRDDEEASGAALEQWLAEYGALVDSQGGRDVAAMKRANPAVVLRNYQAAEAYEAAERGDYEPLNQLHAAITDDPYSDKHEGSPYASPAPAWAASLPGIHIMTCSS